MDSAQFSHARKQLGVSQETLAGIAGVDITLVEQFETGELLPAWGDVTYSEKIEANEKISRALFVVLARAYPEKVEAAVRPILQLAEAYPEGSRMRRFLGSAERFLQP